MSGAWNKSFVLLFPGRPSPGSTRAENCNCGGRPPCPPLGVLRNPRCDMLNEADKPQLVIEEAPPTPGRAGTTGCSQTSGKSRSERLSIDGKKVVEHVADAASPPRRSMGTAIAGPVGEPMGCPNKHGEDENKGAHEEGESQMLRIDEEATQPTPGGAGTTGRLQIYAKT